MVGTRGKGARSKSKDLAFVPDEPEPLNIITGEATVGENLMTVDSEPVNGPNSEDVKSDILNSEVEVVPVSDGKREEEHFKDGMKSEEGFEIGNLIAEGDLTVLPNLDEGDKLEGAVSVDAVTNMDVGNCNDGKNEEELGNDTSHADLENCDDTNNEKEPKVDEDTCIEEDRKACDMNASVTSANEGLAVSETILVAENMDHNKEGIKLAAEEPVSSRSENGDESIKENASPGTEVKDATEKVVQPKKKIIRKKLMKKKISPSKAVTASSEAKLQPSDKNEGSGVSCNAGALDDSKPLHVEDNQATGEEEKSNDNENLKDEEKIEGKPLAKKRTIITKKKSQGLSVVQTGNVEQKPKPTDDEPQGLSGVETSNAEQKPKPTDDEPQDQSSLETGNVEQKPKPTDDEPRSEEIKGEEAVKSKARRNRLRKKKNKKVVEGGNQDVNAKNVDKPGSSRNGKLSKKVDSMGMIFMCSSETKKDCYKYNVFGLPAGKKDVVSKIYKGMRLFLFDVDLKMLYGIYKAAGPGSSNIEPRAFKSKFPSQVRFSVLEDCLPIAEEKFRKVIKDNYYTKNKFDCKLNSDQVKNLCKLFHEATKKSISIRGGQRPRAVASTRVDKKRKRTDDNRRAAPDTISSRERERRRRVPEQVRHVQVIRREEDLRRAPVLRDQDDIDARHALVVRGQEETRLAPVVIDDRYRRPVVVYERDAYLPSAASSSLYQPLRAEDPSVGRIYSYERDSGVATYRRDPILEYRDLGISAARESRHYAERSLQDAYAAYREPRVQREPAYDSATRREHYDYLSTERRYADYYTSDDHRPPLPLHRRY